MATLRVEFGYVVRSSLLGDTVPLMRGRDSAGMTALTTGVTTANVQSGGSDWSAPSTGVVSLRVDGGAVWVKFGTAPTAAAGDVHYLADGERREFSVQAGDKIAVIDA